MLLIMYTKPIFPASEFTYANERLPGSKQKKCGLCSKSHYITLLQCNYLCSSHKFTSFFLL